jgi:hypothetical protein
MRGVIPILLCLAVRGTAADERPIKLDIQPQWYSMRESEPVPVRIRLLNAANAPVQAPKRLDVALQARLPSGEVKSLRSVTFERGESEKQVAITPPGSGVVYLWAKQAELLPGGVFVALRPGPGPQAVVPMRPSAPRLALRYSPDRRFLADGKDTVTVQAFLLSDYTATDIRLNLFDGSGTMMPTPLTIPKGQDTGQAALTFNQPGTVTVEFMASEPPAEVEGNRKLQIPFMPAITHATLEASPPAISLVDKADVVLTFRDNEGRPVASDVARHATFTIDTGRGVLTKTELDVGAGQFEARTSFQPAWLGRVEISAATPNLATASIPLEVSAPIGLLMCSLFGGLAGGYLSYWKHKRSGKRQIVIGAITGFLFYWACLFVGLAAVSHAVAVNPLSALALSAFGGWMQTGVFSFWKGRLKAQ